MRKKQLAAMWSQNAAKYDQIGPPFFAISGRRLVELSGIACGDKILDIAAGRGAILFPAAEQVGREGLVVSVDLARGMVQALAAEISNSHEPTAVCQMDGEFLALAGATFDMVLCGHAIFYFPESIAEFDRVLLPGGRIGLSIVAQKTFDWLWPIFASHTAVEESSNEVESKQPKPAIDTPGGLRHVLNDGGFGDIQIREETNDLLFADEAAWYAHLWTMGIRRAMEEMSPATLQSFKSDLFAALQAFKQPDGLHIQFHTLYGWGTKQI